MFFGDPADFTFALAPDGIFEVVDNLTLEEDALIDIETIEFRDPATNAVIQTFKLPTSLLATPSSAPTRTRFPAWWCRRTSPRPSSGTASRVLAVSTPSTAPAAAT